jgi:hypothetical protein
MDWHDNVISVSTLTERFEELRDEREALADAVSDTQADAERCRMVLYPRKSRLSKN